MPKGRERVSLEAGRKLKRLYVNKDASHSDVKEKICTACNIHSFMYLECVKGGNKLICQLKPADGWQ